MLIIQQQTAPGGQETSKGVFVSVTFVISPEDLLCNAEELCRLTRPLHSVWQN